MVVQGFSVRPAQMDDAPRVLQYIDACERLEEREHFLSAYTVEDLHADWQSVSLQSDTLVIYDQDGRIAGYLIMPAFSIDAQGNAESEIGQFSGVHPGYRGRGIGALLLQHAEQWTQARAGARTYSISTHIAAYEQGAAALLEQHGYQCQGPSLYLMRLTLHEPPASSTWPEQVRVRSFVPRQDDDAVKALVEETFGAPFSNWNEVYLQRENFDPSLWHLAESSNGLVGVILSEPHPTIGCIDKLGVRVDWQGRGLGGALLLHAFNDFYQRGFKRVDLFVEPENQAARQLYERIGMRIARQYDLYTKTVSVPEHHLYTRR
ncbi:GNAT family N-acetyltransferase [Dictyobacter halimunensis]